MLIYNIKWICRWLFCSWYQGSSVGWQERNTSLCWDLNSFFIQILLQKFVFIVAQHSYLIMWLQNKHTPIHSDHISAYPVFFRGWFNDDRVLVKLYKLTDYFISLFYLWQDARCWKNGSESNKYWFISRRGDISCWLFWKLFSFSVFFQQHFPFFSVKWQP